MSVQWYHSRKNKRYTISYQHATGCNYWCLSLHQGSCFHVLSDVTKEFHFRKSIHFRTRFGNWKECQHLQNSLLSLINFQMEEKKMIAPREQVCTCDVRHVSWFSCFDEDRKATHHCALLLSISAAVTSFPRGIAKKSEQNMMFFSTRQKFAAFPEVLIEREGKGNNVTWTWEPWRNLVFQYTGYLNLAQHAMEFNHFGSMDLFEPRISALVATEKKIALDYQRWCMCFSQRLYHSFNSISQISLKFTTEQFEFLKIFFQEVTMFLSWKITMWRRHNPL